MYTIGRRAIDVLKTISRLMHIQRRMHGQCIRFRAIVVLRRNDAHIGHIVQSFVQSFYAWGLVAIVVTNQDFHGAYCTG